MARGLDSLYYKREILNPLKFGRYAWMVASHKLARWLVPLLLPGVLVSLLVLALLGHGLAVAACALVAAIAALAVAAVSWPRDRPMPRPLAMIGYLAVGLAAGTVAWVKAVARERQPVWEPTARESLVEKG